jgi:hypothetical protein
MILLTASILFERIITSPRAPKITPHMILVFVGGFKSPPVANIESTKEALTTLVTTKRKAARTVATLVRLLNGRYLSTKNVISLIFVSTTSRIAASSLSTSKNPTLPKTPNQKIEKKVGTTMTPKRYSRMVRPFDMRAMKTPTKGAQANH